MNLSLPLGRQLRDAGIARVTADPGVMAVINAAREWALSYAALRGRVSINDVRRVCDLSVLHPNAIGSIFRDSRFIAVGFEEATHPEAHARPVRIYQLRGK